MVLGEEPEDTKELVEDLISIITSFWGNLRNEESQEDSPSSGCKRADG